MPLDGTNYLPEIETKPDVFSVEALAAWLETKPATEAYDFFDCNGGCLIGQYLTATTGSSWTENGFDSWLDIDDVHPVLCGVAQGSGEVYRVDRWTFGGALRRARVLLAARSAQ